MAEVVKKKDFIEIKYTGYTNGKVFDSNIEEDLKQINEKAKPKETIVVVGERMVVEGLDNAFEDKEIGKDYEINVGAKEGFGERKKELIKTIPLKIFTEKNINPYPGMVLAMDDALAKIITVSGARVMTDFNNPLAGKDLMYKFRIVRKITDDKEKAKALFEYFLKFVPEFDVGEVITLKGPEFMERVVEAFGKKFKELSGKELKFKLEEKKEEDKKEQTSEKRQ